MSACRRACGRVRDAKVEYFGLNSALSVGGEKMFAVDVAMHDAFFVRGYRARR